MNKRLHKLALLGAILGGVVGPGLLYWLSWMREQFTRADELLLVAAVGAAVGAIAGMASLWRERGLSPLLSLAVVAALMSVARLATVVVVGFRKFNDYPVTPLLVAAVIGGIVIWRCRRPLSKARY